MWLTEGRRPDSKLAMADCDFVWAEAPTKKLATVSAVDCLNDVRLAGPGPSLWGAREGQRREQKIPGAKIGFQRKTMPIAASLPR